MIEELVERVLAGDRRALARVVSHVADATPAGYEAMRLLYPHAGRAHVVGITGPAGSGKSTLTGGLARELRRRGRTVGIVAVDPSSPFSHGAILGDRIRMQDLTSDPGVFLRSVATRGAMGGLSETAGDVVAVLDAAGKDVVLVETVGAGQDEVEIAGTAHTTVVVQTPGAGDDIQALKAGILEIADVLVVNKADLPGAELLVSQLGTLLKLSPARAWTPPILTAVASRDEGVPQIVDTLDQHRAYLASSGRLAEAARERARHQVLSLAKHRLLRRAVAALGDDGLDELVAAVAEHRLDPHSAVDKLIDAAAIQG